jgi:hypothetical protein
MAGPYWEVTIFGNGAGSGTQTVWRFLKTESIEDPQIVCNLIDTHVIQFFKSRLHGNGFFYTGIKAELKDAAQQKVFIKGVNEQGSQSATLLPMQLAVVWNLMTSAPSNKQAGMVYIPGLAGSVNVGGLVGSVGAAQHNNCINQMMTQFGGAGAATGLRWIVRSRKNDALHDVVAVSISTAFGTLRSRRRGKGF